MVDEEVDICRLYKQIFDTIVETDAKDGDLILPYHRRNIGKSFTPTITTRPDGLKTAIYVTVKKCDKINARRLTPRECYRLMGIEDDDIDKIYSIGLSDSHHWKLAGNSIVVDCMSHIFDSLFNGIENKNIGLW